MSRGFAPSLRSVCVVAILALVGCASSSAPSGPGTQPGPSIDLAGFIETDQAVAPNDMASREDLSSHAADLSKPADLASAGDMSAGLPCGSITVFGTCINNNFVSCDPDTNTLDVESCDVCILIEGLPTCF